MRSLPVDPADFAEITLEPSVATGSKRAGRIAWDLAGPGLAVASAGWALVSAAASGGDPLPMAGLFLAVAAAFVGARALSSNIRWAVPAAVIVSACVVLLTHPDDVFSRSPFLVPFGYAHFEWAFMLQATIAGLMLATADAPIPLRVVGTVAAALFAAIPTGGSLLGPVLVAGLLGVLVLIRNPRTARAGILACGVLLAVAVAGTAYIGATYDGFQRWGTVPRLLVGTSNRCYEGCSLDRAEGLDRVVFRVISERRVAFWHQALALTRENPVTGVGPARFRTESSLARTDRDEPWAHHEFLQQGAETGVLGIGLLILVFAWGFWRLWVSPAPDAMTLLGAVALTVLGVHACIDYVFHFPAAPLAAAGLLGAAASPAHSRK